LHTINRAHVVGNATSCGHREGKQDKRVNCFNHMRKENN
jgi:hypothetical protein